MRNILEIVKKNNCTGCSSCIEVCPKKIISLEPNSKGFYVAKIIKEEECVGCGLCLKNCSIEISHLFELRKPRYAYYGWNDEYRSIGTSGGFVSALCSKVIENSGIAYGARLNKDTWNLSHNKIEQTNELYLFSKSKYMQSDMSGVIKSINMELSKGKNVVFCGTPCQAFAVQTSCTEKKENLIVLDFICHGVPSTKLFREYVKKCEKENKSHLLDYDFRSKKRGWSHITTYAKYQNGTEKYSKGQLDEYYYLFANSFSLNEVCFDCPFRSVHFSDFTAADYWGIFGDKQKCDSIEKGISLISVWTEKGKMFLDSIIEDDSQQNHFMPIPLEKIEYTLEELDNKEFMKNISRQFYMDFENEGYDYCIKKYARNLYLKNMKKYISNIVKRLKR